jgi:CheY-like chemotaxis protein
MSGVLGAKDRAGDGLSLRKAQGLAAALAIYAVGVPLVLSLLGSTALLPLPMVVLWLVMSMLGPAIAGTVALRRGATALSLWAERGGEPAQIIIRLFLPGIILAYLIGLTATGIERARLLPLIALDIAATLYAWMLLAHLLLHPERSVLRRRVAMLSDIGLVSMFLHFGAALAVPWFSFYFAIVLGFGAAARTLAAAAVATFAGFAAVCVTTPYWQERPGLAAGVALALVLLPAHMANLLRRLAPDSGGARRPGVAGRKAKATPAGPLDILIAGPEAGEQSLRPMLEAAGHRITMVDRGDAAFTLLERRRFDLALIATELEGMSGCEMARLYRLEHLGDARLPIIALAADGAAETEARCRHAGIDALLARPFAAPTLLAAIDETVARLRRPAAPVPFVSPGGDDTGVLDEKVVASLRLLGGSAFLAELGDAFGVEARQLLEELERSAAAGDAAGFARHLDSLYGGAANIGALRLCRALAMMRSTPADLRDRGAGYVVMLRRELAALEAALAAPEPRRGEA